MNRLAALVTLLLSVVVLQACTPRGPGPAPPATVTPAPSPTLTQTPAPTDTPTMTPTPGPLSATEVFDLVSPSVAYLETPLWSGSGVLLEEGYILTNAHVVWPYETIRVVFPDGSEFLDTPVVGWDLLADLAILGPVETDLAPLELLDGESKVVGSDVYLIGYPGEADLYPQPTISRGLFSHVRQWERLDITYFQTDAAVAGGQSGGVLVSDRGEVIGISGLRVSEANYGLVASAKDLLPRIDMLIAGEPLPDIDQRPMPHQAGQQSYLSALQPDEAAIFVVDTAAGEELTLEVRGDENLAFDLIDLSGGYLLSTTDGARMNQQSSAMVDYDGPLFLAVGWPFDRPGASPSSIQVSSNHELRRYNDSDDDRSLHLDQSYFGSLDFPSDYDRFEIQLSAGDLIHVKVESIMIDPLMLITYAGAGEEQDVWDDDSGRGVLGTDAELSYAAPHAGLYEIVVLDSYDTYTGAYAINVETRREGQPTPIAPAPTPTPIIGEFGNMRLYETDLAPFTLQIPADMTTAVPPWAEDLEPACAVATECLFGQEHRLMLMIVIEDVSIIGDITLQEYADMIEQLVTNSTGASVISRVEVVSAGGQPAVLFQFEIGNFMKFYRLVTLQGGTGFSATYFAVAEDPDSLAPLVEYSLGTFEVSE